MWKFLPAWAGSKHQRMFEVNPWAWTCSRMQSWHLSGWMEKQTGWSWVERQEDQSLEIGPTSCKSPPELFLLLFTDSEHFLLSTIVFLCLFRHFVVQMNFIRLTMPPKGKASFTRMLIPPTHSHTHPFSTKQGVWSNESLLQHVLTEVSLNEARRVYSEQGRHFQTHWISILVDGHQTIYEQVNKWENLADLHNFNYVCSAILSNIENDKNSSDIRPAIPAAIAFCEHI